MPELATNRNDLADMLRKGLGRAVLLARNHYHIAFREPILHACRHNLAYDRQCEELRDQYLYDLIQATGDVDYYRHGIIHSLLHPGDEESPSQIAGIAYRLAKNGDESIKAAMWQGFRGNALRIDFSGDEELIRLDGFTAIQEVIRIQRETGYEAEDYEFDDWYQALEEREGKDAAFAWINEEIDRDSGIRDAWDRVLGCRALYQKARGKRARPKYESYDTLMDCLRQDAKISRIRLASWGERATDEDLVRAATDLLAELDMGMLLHRLRMFRKRAFPLDHSKLVDLARGDGESVPYAALDALEQIRHPDVRQFALELQADPDKWVYGVSLLQRNYVKSDHILIERMLEVPTPPPGSGSGGPTVDQYHFLGMAAGHVFEENKTPDSERSMLLLYENGPCSLCRRRAVKQLNELDRTPGWMREEGRWDANLRIRELVSPGTVLEAELSD